MNVTELPVSPAKDLRQVHFLIAFRFIVVYIFMFIHMSYCLLTRSSHGVVGRGNILVDMWTTQIYPHDVYS
ncbi:putative formin-like protein 6 isoform X1 [Iris pallida]|uniref:Formin-like protein 6 isoform X1 n=1 Tax=Iris pallida TaxID=29817 RepID=A0AAX6H7B9_IRIPA|nr:putative formin-like protein 6 isoform X1 [Iris pallida]